MRDTHNRVRLRFSQPLDDSQMLTGWLRSKIAALSKRPVRHPETYAMALEFVTSLPKIRSGKILGDF